MLSLWFALNAFWQNGWGVLAEWMNSSWKQEFAKKNETKWIDTIYICTMYLYVIQWTALEIVLFEWSCYINTKQHLKFNLCVRGMKMKAWPKTKLQKEIQQGDIIKKYQLKSMGKWKKKPTNAARKCGKRQERQKRQQYGHSCCICFIFMRLGKGGKKGIKRALRCSTWYIVKINFEISRKTFL